MKFRITAFAAAIMVMMSAVSCGSKKDSDSSYSGSDNEQQTTQRVRPDNEKALADDYKNIEDVSEGPVISADNTTVKAGDIAKVTISVKGAERNWSMCGLHITYGEELTPIMETEDDVEFETGDACEKSVASVALIWHKEKLPNELIDNHLGSVFFTTMFKGDDGKDGDIVSFFFKVPDDAVSGTVYPIGFYYLENDAFRNSSNDKVLEKYAFNNWQDGSVTVE